MEVFLFVAAEEELSLLEHTMNAWESIDYAFPVNVVQLPLHHFEVKRRVLADQMAENSHYVLADLGCIPEDGRSLLGIMAKIQASDGLIGFSGDTADKIPSGIRVCRKGVIAKWPEQQSPDYNAEHAAAIRQAGYKVSIWPTTYKQLLAC